MAEVNVLFLDDEQGVRNSLKRLFKDAPFNAYVVRDYKEALKTIERENIKVVFSDQRISGISGIEFLKKVKGVSPDTARILFTACEDILLIEDAINKGEVYRFVAKPWDDKELLHIIKSAIEKYDLAEKNRVLLKAIKEQNQKLTILYIRLKNMYEAQKDFSSTISHELRTPLASIKAMLEILISKTAGDLTENQENFLVKIKGNIDRLDSLVYDVLSLAKFESGKQTLDLKPNDINSIIKEAADMQKPLARKKGLFLNLELSQDMPKIASDENMVYQLLANLLGNATKFTDKGGITVASSVCKDKNCIKVTVKDTGLGIKEEDKEKLFGRFQQLGDPATREPGGTGLGLAISKEIVQKHGGKIWVESNPEKGSSFIFILPI